VSDPLASRQPERAARQRERILDAAEACFIASGFHGASMSQIAETADISAGLIYRYFKNKGAIVKAIIDRHLESEAIRVIDRLNATDDMVDELLNVFERFRSRKDPKMNAALMLELTAESTRDPTLMQVVRTKDRVVGASLRHAVRRSAAAQGVRLTAAEARTRAVMLQCLVEGLAMRSIRDPTLRRSALRPSIKMLVAALLS
jgi:AcrR family transcriptional regulator